MRNVAYMASTITATAKGDGEFVFQLETRDFTNPEQTGN